MSADVSLPPAEQQIEFLRQVAGLWKRSRFASGVLLRKYSFLGGHHLLVEARGVRVGQIRRLLIRLIKHFSSAAGIFRIFLKQVGIKPDVFVWINLASGDF